MAWKIKGKQLLWKERNKIGKMMFAVAETREWRGKQAASLVWLLQITAV